VRLIFHFFVCSVISHGKTVALIVLGHLLFKVIVENVVARLCLRHNIVIFIYKFKPFVS